MTLAWVSDPLVELVVDAPRTRRTPCAGTGCRRVHSWTADVRRVCWRHSTGQGRAAVDAERPRAQVPPSLAARWGLSGEPFWQAWTRAEVYAKLSGVPILVWLQRHGLHADPPTVQTRTLAVADLVVTVGWHRDPP